MRTLLAISAVTAAIVAAVWIGWDHQPSTDTDSTHVITLKRVSNASGMVLMKHNGETVIATVDEVDEWTGKGAPPPLILFSSTQDGSMVGGKYDVGQFGEVEALAIKNGKLAFPYKTGAQSVILKFGKEDIRLVDPPLINKLNQQMKSIAEPPYFFEFEGLAATASGWELLCSAVRPDARDTPRSTMAVFRIAFDDFGKLVKISPAIRQPNGDLYTDYAAALDVIDSDLALIPGFHQSMLSLVNWEGKIVKQYPTPANRVEGVAWDSEHKMVYLVRECVGTGTSCADGVHFGVPLWIVPIPGELL